MTLILKTQSSAFPGDAFLGQNWDSLQAKVLAEGPLIMAAAEPDVLEPLLGLQSSYQKFLAACLGEGGRSSSWAVSSSGAWLPA